MNMPDWTQHVRPRLSTLRLSPTREAEIVEELSQHLDDRWRELIAGGMSPDEATRTALADFRDGNLLAEYLAPLRQAHPPSAITPGAPRSHLFSDLWQDLRYAARILWTRPGFAIAVVFTLAIGIGSNAAIFSVINAVLIRPLPFPHGEQLLALYTRSLPSAGFHVEYGEMSVPEFADIRGRVSAFAGVAAYNFQNRNLTRGNGEAERVITMRVTSDFFDVLGVRPARGRSFDKEDARPGRGCLALLSHDASENAANAIGSTIRLDDAPCEVIGVTPKGFVFRDDRVKVWTALPVEDTLNNRGAHGIYAIARLRDGATQAGAQLQSVHQYWSENYPPVHYAKGHTVISRPLHEDMVGDQRDALLLLGGAVIFVLLIVCVNLAALLISNGEARRREFAVRHALGANRRRLIRQLAAETMLLAAAGGLIGFTLAKPLLAGLLALYPERLPVSQAITIDYAAALYTCALVITAGFAVGIVPALHATGARIQEILRTDSRTATSSRRTIAARSALVIGQLALSVILLVGALLLIRSFQRLQQVDLGLEPDHALTFAVTIPRARQDDAAAKRTLEAIEERLAATPGVEIAGAISYLPIASVEPQWSFDIDGRPQPPPGARFWQMSYLTATPQVFPALGIPLKRGRLLAKSDVAGQPSVAVINETAARFFWPDEDPIGRTIRYGWQDPHNPIQIVGIVGDVRSQGAGRPAPPAVYVPLAQSWTDSPGRFSTFVIRTRGNPVDIAASARAAVASIDAGLPLADLRPLSEVVSAASGQPRFTTLVMSFFAIIAFFLAALGLYGILAYSVEQRVREIGVRVALGADKGEIFRLIIGAGMRLALVGAGVGVTSALALTRLMSGMLSGVTSTDPVTYIAVVGMLAISALLASYLPARRATRVDPIVALRAE
jgi:putative ABC transport system permease protein